MRWSLRLAAGVGALLWMIGIFVLSAQSTLPRTGGIPVDVIAIAGHLVAYAVLAGLIRIAVGDARRDRRADILAVALATIYGLTDEFHQSFVPGRNASAFDVVVDLVGATAGIWIIDHVRALRESAKRPRW